MAKRVQHLIYNLIQSPHCSTLDTRTRRYHPTRSPARKEETRPWAPDLDNPSDTLYNEACRISAIKTFRQLSAGGAYEYTNINWNFLNDIQFLEATYNHIVYWSLAQQYKKELKQSGKYKKDKERSAILQARLRLKKACYAFGVAQGFPNHYLKLLLNIDAYSNDECDPKGKRYIIRRIECQSEQENSFMHRVDEEMEKVDQDNGMKSQRRKQYVPAVPAKSICTQVPKGLPIDFYDPTWFNSRPPGQKTVISDYLNVAFLPDSLASIWGIQHTDEKLSDRKFTGKYWDKVIGPYDISHKIPNEYSDESEGELSDGLDVVSNQEQSEDEEYEEGEINPGLEQDTKMAHAQDLNCYTVPHQNDWAGW
ncbi:hypothetical protein O181_121112 [Austropuccinia psidii MF-1]|uniref:Uncharacterized protein n=1 Tax=Austropuccinia psidii MF-1 TaxID=1389203 RepID=A0A9Q3KIB1_9BASI|nr:hypothetical protein [Austropuccinia psidii MF-1]